MFPTLQYKLLQVALQQLQLLQQHLEQLLDLQRPQHLVHHLHQVVQKVTGQVRHQVQAVVPQVQAVVHQAVILVAVVLLVLAGLRDQVVDRQVAVDMEEDTNV